MNSEMLIRHINPPKYLAVLFAYTVASDALHIFEKEHPNNLHPRKALDLVKRYLDEKEVSGVDLRLAANNAYIAYNNSVDAYAVYAAANAAYAAAANVIYIADVSAAAYWAARETSEEHVIKLIYSLMPQLIDYAIKNQVRLFNGPGDFTEVFDKLDDEIREEVIWNMELFR